MSGFKTGDLGQRYEIRCDDGNGEEMVIGWSEDPEAFKKSVELHPSWSNHRAIDRGTEMVCPECGKGFVHIQMPSRPASRPPICCSFTCRSAQLKKRGRSVA